MTPDVQRDFDASQAYFHRLVWPVIAPLVGGGEVVAVESKALQVELGLAPPGIVREAASVLARLDVLCGIDAYQVMRGGVGVRGIASRVQFDSPFPTFTIRLGRDSGSTTEWEKRLLAVTKPEQGYLSPHLTVQAYVDREREKLFPDGVAVVRTAELVKCTAASRPGPFRCVKESPRKDGKPYVQRAPNAFFIVVPWAFLSDCGVEIRRPELSEAA